MTGPGAGHRRAARPTPDATASKTEWVRPDGLPVDVEDPEVWLGHGDTFVTLPSLSEGISALRKITEGARTATELAQRLDDWSLVEHGGTGRAYIGRELLELLERSGEVDQR